MLLLPSDNFCESMPVTLPKPNRAKRTLHREEKKDVKAKFLHLGVGLTKKPTSPTRTLKNRHCKSPARPILKLNIDQSANTCHQSPRRSSCSITSPLQSPYHHSLNTPIFTPGSAANQEPSFTNTERRQQEDLLLSIDFSSPLGHLISQEVSETLKKKLSVTSDYEEYCKESFAKSLRVPRTIPGPWAGAVRNNRRHKNPKRTHYLNSRQRKEKFLALKLGIGASFLAKRRNLIKIQQAMKPCYVKMLRYPELDRIIDFLDHPHLRIKITDRDTHQTSRPTSTSTNRTSMPAEDPPKLPEVVDLTAESDDETSRQLTPTKSRNVTTCKIEDSPTKQVDDAMTNQIFVRELSPSDFDNDYASMTGVVEEDRHPVLNQTSTPVLNPIENHNGDNLQTAQTYESSNNNSYISVSSSTSTESTRRTNRIRKFPERFENML